MKNATIFDTTATFFPFLTNGSHWTLAVVRGGQRRIDYYDSMPSKHTARVALSVGFCCLFALFLISLFRECRLSADMTGQI